MELNLAEQRQSRRTGHDAAVSLCQIDVSRRGPELSDRKRDIGRRKLQQDRASVIRPRRFERGLVAVRRRELDGMARYCNAMTRRNRTLGTTLEWRGTSIESVGR